MLTIDVLGPLRVAVDGARRAVTDQGAAALCWLAMYAGRTVPMTAVARAVAGDGAPLTTYRVRAILGPIRSSLPEGALTVSDRCMLTLDDEGLDSRRFDALADDASRAWNARDVGTTETAVRAALRLWRGDPYPELRGVTDAYPEINRLERTHLSLLTLGQELATRDHVDYTTVADLRTLVAAYPTHLAFRLHLARALYLLGRQVDALATIRDAASDLDTHPATRRWHDLIARHDPDVATVAIIDDGSATA